MQNAKTGEPENAGNAENQEKNPPHIFDRGFKRLMASSSPAIVQLINGLCNTDYPLDTPVKQLATEHITDGLDKFISDIIFQVGNDRFLIEVVRHEVV